MTFAPKMQKPQHTEDPTISSIKLSESDKKYENSADRDIWKAFNKGNETAFNYIYRVYAPALFQYGWQFSKDKNILQDCIQNIFIYLRSKRGDLTKVNSIRAYLFKIMQREVLRMVKSEKQSIHSSWDYNERIFPIEICHETKLIQQEYDIEMKRKIQYAMNQLTSRQRQAVLLLIEEGMNYKEIAEVMEFSDVRSARKIIYRALDTLKVLIRNKK
ncbi:sigma-70 family RNA polymerase sigma factor [Cyclobacterium sp. 1_MG-2023]|uniref:RNA polymerase sigma factor n=1 Tax=Cyclobacterium sp. 1_MG-2023 TaxID=3062681 RepID=UPI0026E2243E|nr:sigma-70 family RNA polymerase sigma factor [Cyclobacterium sp. 1_MG-2023]MDO6440406.1 sigma-70 family RNA polymerase sigma factor [Cyclobacterium sp. 1_MG-2023]